MREAVKPRSWRTRATVACACTFAAVASATTGGCLAQPDPISGETAVSVSDTRYASVATCTPNVSCTTSPCSTENPAVGEPDGEMVNIGNETCKVLDVVLTGGTIVAVDNTPDLVVHLGSLDANAVAVVQASNDGLKFETVAFINGVPTGINLSCAATMEGSAAFLDLKSNGGDSSGGCTHVPNVSHLRFSRYGGPVYDGVLEIDAVEAQSCSFVPLGSMTSSCGT